MLTVTTLAADPALGLELVAGRRNAGREIEASAVSELVDAGNWLQGGELLLTIGLLLAKTTDGCRDYLASLDAAGVRAVGLGLGSELPHQAAPERLIAAADEVGMPLLTVPEPVPFIAVTRAVFAHRAREEREVLEWTLRTQRALTAAAVFPGGLTGPLTAHHEATGRTAVVVDLLGRALAECGPGSERLVAASADALAAIRPRGLAGAAVDIGAGRRREVHALGARRLRAWLLVDGPDESPSAYQQTSADLVSLLSLELERRHGLTGAQRRGRATVLDRLARATVDDEVAARWLASTGIPAGDLRAGAIAAPDDADELAADLVTSLPDALVRAAGDLVELAVPVRMDLSAVLGVLAAGRPAGIGIGVRPGAVALSLRQARSALPTSRLRGRPVRAEEIADSRSVLAAAGPEALRAYADAALGPVQASPRAAELLRALTAFLDHNGHWGSAAAALGVHRHTVAARIRAVEELTGRRLDVPHDRHELWLALRATEAARFAEAGDESAPAP